jgi:heparanase 1
MRTSCTKLAQAALPDATAITPTVNSDRVAARMLTVPVPGERYTLSSDDLQGRAVRLNGVALKLRANDALPDLAGAPVPAGKIVLDPATITFIALPEAGNQACL